MKNLLKKLTAITSVCVMALSGAVYNVSAEDVEISDITISFDCFSDDITLKEEYAELLQPVTVSPNESIIIPEAFPKREGYYFTGWTYDGIHAYTYNDVFRSPDGNDVVLQPVWTLADDENEHILTYYVELDGKEVDKGKRLPDAKCYAGQVITVSLESFTSIRSDAAQFGWIFEGLEFRGQEKFIMPDHDVTLTPNWKKKYNIYYTVGDVDRVVGLDHFEYQQPETIATDLQADNRFSRNGFKIVGWLCDDDGEIYKPSYSKYVMPSHDVTFTAVWEAKEYNVVFKQDSSAKNNIKIAGLTDTTIKTPEATIKKDGQYLAGWKDDSDGTVYPVGAEYMIKGAIAGKGITLTAVWEDGEAPSTTNSTSDEKVSYGDANGDGTVNISDAVLIMQVLAGAGYSFPEGCENNADVFKTGDGVTGMDALIIQMVDMQVIDVADLPVSELPDFE